MKKRIFILAVSVIFPVSSQAISLRESILQTVKHNPEITVIGHRRQAVDGEVKQARAGYLPSIDFNLSYGRERTNTVLNTPAVNTLSPRKEGVVLRQPIFDGFLAHNEVYRTKAKANAQAFMQEGTAQDFALNTAGIYLNLMRDREIVNASHLRLDAHRRIYGMIKARADSGISRKAETNQVLTRLEAAEADYYSSISNLDDQQTSFHRITGFLPVHGSNSPDPNINVPNLPTSDISLTPPPLPPRSILPVSERQLIAQALENDPVVKSAYQDMEEAKGQEFSARSQFYPTVDLLLGGNRNRNLAGNRGRDNDTYALVEANYNLFRGGRDVGRLNQTIEQYNEAMDIHRNAVRQATEKAKYAWTAYEQTTRRMRALKRREIEAQNTVDAYLEQFRLGKRTLLDFLNSENDLFNARIAYIDNLYKYKFSLYRLLNSQNKLLAFFHVPLPRTARAIYHLPHSLHHEPVSHSVHHHSVHAIHHSHAESEHRTHK